MNIRNRSMKPKIKIKFVDFWTSNLDSNALYQLLLKNFDLELTDDPDFVIHSCFGKKFLKYNCVRIFYTGENVRPNFNECDYAFSFDYPIDDKNYRLPLYRLYFQNFENVKNKVLPVSFDKNRKFCNFVYSNYFAKDRVEFFNKLNRYKRVDSGGKSQNNLGYFVDDKIEFLSKYKFTIAFENSSYPGYTTEKILHAFEANTIPIYWGNPLVAKDFNPKSFINCHDYKNFEQVIERVIEIDNNDELYKKYLNESAFIDTKNEFINEQLIYKRFESIFSNKNLVNKMGKKTDNFKYYCIILIDFLIKIIEKAHRAFKKYLRI